VNPSEIGKYPEEGTPTEDYHDRARNGQYLQDQDIHLAGLF
jgi:hypothetical protein